MMESLRYRDLPPAFDKRPILERPDDSPLNGLSLLDWINHPMLARSSIRPSAFEPVFIRGKPTCFASKG